MQDCWVSRCAGSLLAWTGRGVGRHRGVGGRGSGRRGRVQDIGCVDKRKRILRFTSLSGCAWVWVVLVWRVDLGGYPSPSGLCIDRKSVV